MGCITIYICIYVCIMYVYSIHIWGGVPVREASHTGQPELGAQPCEANCSHSDWDLLPLLVAYCSYTISGWWFGTFGLLFHILGRIIPTDEVIFFRGLAQPPTSRCVNGWVFLACYFRQLSWPQGFTSAINELFPPENGWPDTKTWSLDDVHVKDVDFRDDLPIWVDIGQTSWQFLGDIWLLVVERK